MSFMHGIGAYFMLNWTAIATGGAGTYSDAIFGYILIISQTCTNNILRFNNTHRINA